MPLVTGRRPEGRQFSHADRGDGRLWLQLVITVPPKLRLTAAQEEQINELVLQRFNWSFSDLREHSKPTTQLFQPKPVRVPIDESRCVFVQIRTNSDASGLKITALCRSIGQATADIIDRRAHRDYLADCEAISARRIGKREEPPKDGDYAVMCTEILDDPPSDESNRYLDGEEPGIWQFEVPVGVLPQLDSRSQARDVRAYIG